METPLPRRLAPPEGSPRPALLPRRLRRHQPRLTARTYRALLKDAKTLDRPLGIFPEGVVGTAFQMAPPLPGVDPLFVTLAKLGLSVVPCGMHETDRLIVRFGPPISPTDLVMAHIQALRDA